MAFRKFPLLFLCCFSMAVAGCANKQKSEVQQPGAMTNVAVVVTPRQGSGPATAALNKGGKTGDHCLLAMVKPADGPINSPYGNRRLGRKTKFHKGIDIGAKRGSDVVAAAAGKVVFCGRKKGYGRTVEIEHSNGVVTRYAHLDAIFASEGQTVKQCDRLGLVGRSGHATGPNLHFELLAQGRPVNPLNEGWINASSNDDLTRFATASGADDAGVMVADADDGGMADVNGIPDIRSARVKSADMKAASAKSAGGKDAGLTTASAKSGKNAKRTKSTGAKSVKAAGVKAPAAKVAGAKAPAAKVASAKAPAGKVAGAKGAKS